MLPFTFSVMETLTIRRAYDHDTTSTLPELPSLTNPSLTFHPEHAFPEPTFALDPMIRCPLDLNSPALSDSDLVYFLSHLPTLQDLNIANTFSGNPLTHQFVESLHSYHTRPLHQQTAPCVKITLYSPVFKSRWT